VAADGSPLRHWRPCQAPALCAVARRKKQQFIRIDGSTPAQARAGLVAQFQTNAACRVAVLSIKAAGAGITLTVRILSITSADSACTALPRSAQVSQIFAGLSCLVKQWQKVLIFPRLLPPLQAASSCVFCEYSWTPGDIVQAEDRAHRIGQVSFPSHTGLKRILQVCQYQPAENRVHRIRTRAGFYVWIARKRI